MFKKLTAAVALLVPAAVGAFPVGPIDWLARINAPAAHETATGKGVRVAVVDGGVAGADEEKVFTGEADPKPGRHGSVVGATIRAVAPGATLVSAKVGVDVGGGQRLSATWVRNGAIWALENSDVVNISLGREEPDQVVADAIKAAVARGVIVVVAAGNDGPADHTTHFPARMPEVVTVAALGPTGAPAEFSSRGPTVTCAAPGVSVFARNGRFSGTSVSAPMVAGVAALWIEAHPSVQRADRSAAFKKKLAATCRDLGPAGHDPETGYGLVDARKVVTK